jgi:hypothetical protein
MSGIPSGPLLLVSPHLDDAVLSCEALVGGEEPIDVLNVFTGAPDPPQRGWWDLECGFANSDESVAARKREDEGAFAGTPHRRAHLDLLELQHTPRRTREDRRAICVAVTDWLGRNPDGIVALPAGAGCRQHLPARWLRKLTRSKCSPPQHMDHLNVRNAVLRGLPSAEIKILLYEEVPYVFGGGADWEVHRLSKGRNVQPISVAVDRERKAARVAAYASQIPHISPDEGRLDDPSILPTHERYWLLRRPKTTLL